MSPSLSLSAKPPRRLRLLSATAATVALVLGSFAMASSASADIDDFPVNSVAPVISGTPTVGEELTVTDGEWTDVNSGGFTYSYVWSVPGVASLGTDASYTPTVTDLGKVLTVTVTATEASDPGYNNATSAAVSTATPVVSAVVNTVAPSISGSLTLGSTLTVDPGTWTAPDDLTYRYAWSASIGESGDMLDDVDATHVITADDIGAAITVIVTATSATDDFNTASVSTERIVPPAPYATDAGLTSTNKGTITVTQPNRTTAVVSVTGGVAGTSVYVYGYSTPTGLGFYTLDATGAITVSLASLGAGEHRLLVLDASGTVIGWVTVTVGSVLAATGAEISVPLVISGGALLVFGLLAVLYVARRRRSNP